MSSEKKFVHNRFYLWFTKLNLHHVILWLLYFFFWAYAFRPGDSFSDIIINSLVIVAVHAIVSYFNIYYLFPNFVHKKQYTAYLFAVIMSITLGALLQATVLMLISTLDMVDKPDLFSLGFLLNSAMAITYTTAITMSLKLVKHWYENDRLSKQLANLNTETELKYLKAQINPHFLFNSLNSIYALSLKKSDLTPDLILKLSDILRYLLYDGSEKKVSLKQEVKYLKSYMELEKVRHGDRMDLNFDISGDLDAYEIPPMLLIPFVENSFKHGLSKDRAKGFINVKLNAENDLLEFVLSNSKPKNGSELSNQSGYQGGIGIQNVRKRLNLLYPNNHKLELGGMDEEFKVSLKLNL